MLDIYNKCFDIFGVLSLSYGILFYGQPIILTI